jgi:hypothetical protein
VRTYGEVVVPTVGASAVACQVQAPPTAETIPEALTVTDPAGAEQGMGPHCAGRLAGGAIENEDAVVTFTIDPLL